MALDVFEKNQIENLINHLMEVYPNDLDSVVLEQIKTNVFASNNEASFLTREISSLFKGDKKRLESFLTKYQIDVKKREQEVIKTNREYEIKKENNQNNRDENFNVVEFDDKDLSYSIEEIRSATMGMNEEEIVDYLKIHGKNPGQIMMIMLALEEIKMEKENINLEKPKQKIYIKNPKIAAFTNTFMLAFLTGALSGGLFFIMLRVFLKVF